MTSVPTRWEGVPDVWQSYQGLLRCLTRGTGIPKLVVVYEWHMRAGNVPDQWVAKGLREHWGWGFSLGLIETGE